MNNKEEKEYKCPECGVIYVRETPCGAIGCRDMSPIPIAKEMSTNTTTWEERFDKLDSYYTNPKDLEMIYKKELKDFIAKERNLAQEELISFVLEKLEKENDSNDDYMSGIKYAISIIKGKL